MPFRFRKFRPFKPVPVAITEEQQVINFDDKGVQHVSYAVVSADSIIHSMPRPSEVTLLSQMQSGNLRPVNLQDFEYSDMDASTASDFINSLNVSENENT
ncbi:hypothetical protein [Prevotella sp.]|uniref:hypothetical protein n=1 Tax=Prevotella sp. TaxID=59823 RepID=UPI0027E2866E|nr:hypothetical protein [Prevotella sp.]